MALTLSLPGHDGYATKPVMALTLSLPGHDGYATKPVMALTLSLPGNTVCASTRSSARRWSFNTPLSTARRSVVGLRSRFS